MKIAVLFDIVYVIFLVSLKIKMFLCLLWFRDVFRSLLLSFSPNLEEHNPSVAEWRQDVGRVVRATLAQVHCA